MTRFIVSFREAVGILQVCVALCFRSGLQIRKNEILSGMCISCLRSTQRVAFYVRIACAVSGVWHRSHNPGNLHGVGLQIRSGELSGPYAKATPGFQVFWQVGLLMIWLRRTPKASQYLTAWLFCSTCRSRPVRHRLS